MRIDPTDLRLFLEIVEAKSITVGASRMNLALATASTRIRNMEEQLGTRVLDRLHRGIEPTAAGQALIRNARIILQQFDQMHRELAEFNNNRKQLVRLLANTAAASEFLPDILSGFLASRPNVDIDLGERPSVDIVQSIVDGLGDIGVISDTVEALGTETFPLVVDRLVLVVPEGHEIAACPKVAFHQVTGGVFVGLTPDRALHHYLKKHALLNGYALKYRICVRTFDDLCKMVARGVGVAVVSEAAGLRCRETLPLNLVPLTDPWATRSLLVCFRRVSRLPKHVQDLVDHLRTVGDGVLDGHLALA